MGKLKFRYEKIGFQYFNNSNWVFINNIFWVYNLTKSNGKRILRKEVKYL